VETRKQLEGEEEREGHRLQLCPPRPEREAEERI